MGGERGKNVHEASFRRHISMNCLISDTSFGMVGEIESEDGVFELCRSRGIFRFKKLAISVGVA